METTGKLTKSLVNSWLTVIFMNPKTGLVLESASIHGNAEEPDNAKVKVGAMVMMPVKRSTSELITRQKLTQ